MTFGQRLKQLRKEKGMTLEDVAGNIGVTRATIQRYETGKITNVPLETYDKLAALFGVCRPFLLGWTDDRGATMSDVSIMSDSSTFVQAYSALTQEERKLLSDILIIAYGRYLDGKKS